MKDEDLKRIELLLLNEKALEAKEEFNTLEPRESAAYYLLKGKIEQKFQQWGEALNAYHHVLELEPENREADNNIHFIQNILNFWNPEMFNP